MCEKYVKESEEQLNSFLSGKEQIFETLLDESKLMSILEKRLKMLSGEIPSGDIRKSHGIESEKPITRDTVLKVVADKFTKAIKEVVGNILNDWDAIESIFVLKAKSDRSKKLIQLVRLKCLGDESHNNARNVYKLEFSLHGKSTNLRVVYKSRDIMIDTLLAGNTKRIFKKLKVPPEVKALGKSIMEHYNDFEFTPEKDDLEFGYKKGEKICLQRDCRSLLLPTVKLLPCQFIHSKSCFHYGYMEYISRKKDLSQKVYEEYRELKHKLSIHDENHIYIGKEIPSPLILEFVSKSKQIINFIQTFNITDQHAENLIFTSIGPHLIDLECAFIWSNTGVRGMRKAIEDQFIRHKTIQNSALVIPSLDPKVSKMQIVDLKKLRKNRRNIVDRVENFASAIWKVFKQHYKKEISIKFLNAIEGKLIRLLPVNTKALCTLGKEFRKKGLGLFKDIYDESAVNELDLMAFQSNRFADLIEIRDSFIIGDVPTFYLEISKKLPEEYSYKTTAFLFNLKDEKAKFETNIYDRRRWLKK